MPAYLVIYFGYLRFKKSILIKPITVGPRDISKLFHVHNCTEAYRTLKELEPPHVSKANEIYWPKVIQLTELTYALKYLPIHTYKLQVGSNTMG